jgi:hypothetical protein
MKKKRFFAQKGTEVKKEREVYFVWKKEKRKDVKIFAF